ncbi:MAG: PAS domain S-box protein [Bacteroidales bacterium]
MDKDTIPEENNFYTNYSFICNKLQHENALLKQVIFEYFNMNLETDSLYTSLHNSEIIPYIAFDENGIIQKVNTAWLTIINDSEHNVIHKHIQEFLSQFSQKIFNECFPLLQQNKLVKNVFEELIDSQGNIKHVLKSGILVYDEKLKCNIAHCVYLDISIQLSCYNTHLENEKEWNIIFNTISSPIIILDAAQNIVQCNDAVQKLSGLDRSEIIGMKCFSAFHNSSCSPANCPCKKLLQTKQHTMHEMYVELFNGIFIVSCTPIFDKEGNIKNIIHVATDITEKIEYEKKILLREQQYKNVVLNTEVVSFIIDKNGIFTLSEGGGLHKIGLEPGEVVGKSVFDVYKHEPHIISDVVRALQGEHIRNNIVLNDVHFEVLYTPIKDNKDSITQVIGLAIDNTNNVETELAIKEQEKKFRKLFSQMDQGVVIFEATYNSFHEISDFIYIDVNESYEELINIPKEKLLYKSLFSIVPSYLHTALFKKISSVLQTGNSLNYEEFLKSVDAYVDVVMYKSQENQVVTILRDITDKKKKDELLREKSEELEAQNEEYLQLNEELLQANQELYEAKEKAIESDTLKSSFLANLSHEIRTPMNAILGFSDLLHDAETYDDKEHYISIIQKSGEHLMSIINDIVDVSKIETGQVQPYYEIIYVKPFILDVYKAMEITIPSKKPIKFELAYAHITDDTVLYIDQVKLRQVLINLLSNAIKFTNSGKIIFACSMKQNNKEIEFVVSDTGIGIEEKYYTAIFDRFRQVQSDSNIKSNGSGLGLAISKAYVEMMGGEITVSSEVHKGSIFTVLLPCIEKNEKKPIKQHIPDSQYVNDFGKGETIIIAEDDDINYFYLSRLFANTKFNTIRAENGKEAIEKVSENPDVKLVLMDIKMPVMNGYEAARRIQKKYPQVAVVAQTAYALVEDEIRINDAGFYGYMRKPIKRDSLFEVLHSVYS